MRTARIVSVAVLLSAGIAMGASQVSFELGLQEGDAGGIPCNVLPTAFFSGHNPTDGQALGNAVPATWSVKVMCSGTQDSGPGAGYAVQGVANIVFDIELYEGSVAPENLVASALYSSTNDGSDGCVLAAAAFAPVFDIDGRGPGRLIDPRSTPAAGEFEGGPSMGRTGDPWFPGATQPGVPGFDKKPAYNYPTDTGTGKLLGMGAGYHWWKRDGSLGLRTTAGVGMDLLPGGSAGLGSGPIAEGQIDTSSLTVGQTYILRLVPGDGINVLRGDLNLTGSYYYDAFATPAESVQGGAADTQISFTVYDGGGEINITGWASLRHHGLPSSTVSLYELALDPTGPSTAGIEPRWNNVGSPHGDSLGGIKMIAVDFDADVSTTYQSGAVIEAVDAVTPANVYQATDHYLDPGSGGTRLIVEFMADAPSSDIRTSDSILPNEKCYVIDIAPAVPNAAGDTDCHVRSVTADVAGAGGVYPYGNGIPNLDDFVETRTAAKSFVALSDATCHLDMDTNSLINLDDAINVRTIVKAYPGGAGETYCPN